MRMNARTSSHPAAYLRRSHVDPESPGDISKEAQRAVVRKLAAADGHNGDLVEYDDWGVSADIANSAKRTAYAKLLADMEAGTVNAVYAFDVDRLYRDMRDLIRLQDAARQHQVRVVTTAGELPIGDGADPTAEAFALIGAVFGGTELKKAKKRARAARDARKARGDDMGRPPYGYRLERQGDGRVTFVRNPAEPVEPVIAAFEEAGSFGGAARLLNERRIPSKRGTRWAGNVVNKIIRRERPNLVPRGRSEPRVAPRGTHLFSRLLRCHCGRLMTPRVNYTTTKYGRYGPYIGYQCHDGRYDAAHGKPYMVNEASILEWAKAEAARFRVPGDAIPGADHDDERSALEAQRERLGWAVADGLLTRDAAKARAGEIDAQLGVLEAQAQAVQVPQVIDWEGWRQADVNAVLRTYWDYIELDRNMQPVRAEWRLPAEYIA